MSSFFIPDQPSDHFAVFNSGKIIEGRYASGAVDALDGSHLSQQPDDPLMSSLAGDNCSSPGRHGVSPKSIDEQEP
jgi:hypothetical protein